MFAILFSINFNKGRIMKKLFLLIFLISSSLFANDALECSKIKDWSMMNFCKSFAAGEANYISIRSNSYDLSKGTNPANQNFEIISTKFDQISEKNSKIKRSLDDDFENAYKATQSLIRNSGNWQLCSESFLPYCTIIVLSKSPDDHRGNNLDGKPAPELFVQTRNSSIVLMKRFLENFEIDKLKSKNEKHHLSTVTQFIEAYDMRSSELDKSEKEFKDDVKSELIPAAREALKAYINKF